MANSNLKDLFRKRDEAENALKAAQGKVTELTARGDQLQREIAGIAGSKEKAKSEKAKVLEVYVVDNTNKVLKENYDQAKRRFKDIEEAEAELNEILTATERARISLIESIPKLKQALDASEVEIWQEIMRDILSKITPSTKELITKAFTAGAHGGQCITSYQDFILNLFPQPPIDDMNAIKKSLELEYFGQ